jgi:hypothetical protein
VPAVTASSSPLGLNTTDVGAPLRGNGEPDTDVRAPEEPTENIEMVSLLLFAPASSVPLGLKATEVANGSGGVPPSGLSAPEAATENSSVPLASSAPLGLNARPPPPAFPGDMSGEPGARVYVSSLAAAALGARKQIAAIATPRHQCRGCKALTWLSGLRPVGASLPDKASESYRRM